jgi:hypothetical protein
VGVIAARRAHIFNCCDCPLGTTSFYVQELPTSSSYFVSVRDNDNSVWLDGTIEAHFHW